MNVSFLTVSVSIICCLVVKIRLIIVKQMTASMVHVILNKLITRVIAMPAIQEIPVMKISMNVLQIPVYTEPAWMEKIHIIASVKQATRV